MGKTFNEDIDDAFLRLALHFTALAAGIELEEVIIVGGQLLIEHGYEDSGGTSIRYDSRHE